MDQTFEYQIRLSIDKLKGESFNFFVNELLRAKHGNSFKSIQQKQDQGCDGILNDTKIIAAYAPSRYKLATFKSKIKKDRIAYETNWQKDYLQWMVIYNGELNANIIKFVNSLDSNADCWGIDDLMACIKSLQWSKVREISQYLGIDEQYFINDIIRNIVEDMLKDGEERSSELSYSHPVYMPDKIEKNYAKEDVQSAIDEYTSYFPVLSSLKDVLKSYKSDEIRALKVKVKEKYDTLGGNFKSKLSNLVDALSERNINDDVYKFYVRGVLIYIFEICLIGKKVDGEQS